MTVRLLVGIAATALASGIAYSSYMQVVGYPAWQIEEELCKGRQLVEQAGSSALMCSRTKIGDPIPVSFQQYRLDPEKRFTLADMGGLCKLDKEEPRDMGGTLGCMPIKRSVAKR